LRYGQHFFCFLIKKKFCHTDTFLLTASNEKHLTDFVNATKLHLRRGGGARLVNLVLRSPLQEPAIAGDFPLGCGIIRGWLAV
jgi:hypothetical protein